MREIWWQHAFVPLRKTSFPMNIPEHDRTFPSTAAGLRAGVKLSRGGHLPWLGLGVYQLGGDAETAKIVRTAIELGYRSVDTASIYGNERGVGEAITTC